jgi:DinB superfamily
MTEISLHRLNFIIGKASKILTQISEEKMSEKPAPNKWSKKEILGHLIDSATNNHQRIIRGQFEHHPQISYDQNQWNKFGFYQDIDSQQIILFWKIYNRQLIEIIKRIPADNLQKQVKVGDSSLTIEYLIIDYM